MRPIRNLAKSPVAFAVALSLTYLAGALCLLPWFQGSINPDGICYISIARRYLAGDWQGAVNGYWSPLYSWGLIPFLACRIEPLLASKLLSILIGLFSLCGLQFLASRFALSAGLRAILLTALLPALWWFTFQVITPDFLIACVLVWYFSVIFAPGYLDRRRNAAIAGALGALAYLAKGYGFYFFLAHFTLFAALFWLSGRNAARRRTALLHYAIGLALFAILAGGWIGALSHKYGELTVATAARYNQALMTCQNPRRAHPMLHGFIAPRDGAAISIWEDPSSLSVPVARSSRVDKLKRQARLVADNWIILYKKFNHFSLLALIILASSAWLCVKSRSRCLQPGADSSPLFTLLLYSAGYSLILVEERYLYVCLFLLALMGARLIQRLADKGWMSGRHMIWMALLLGISFAVMPLSKITFKSHDNNGQKVEMLAVKLARQTSLHGTIASNSGWAKTLAVAYKFGLRYVGQRGDTPLPEVRPALSRLGVHYYFVWNGSNAEHAMFKDCPEITDGKIATLKIYQLSDPTLKPDP